MQIRVRNPKCQAMWWVMHRGWKRLCLVGNNQSSLRHAFKLKAGLGLLTQQKLVRKVSYLLALSELEVWLFWGPTLLMPADPMSRYVEEFVCSLHNATQRAYIF